MFSLVLQHIVEVKFYTFLFKAYQYQITEFVRSVKEYNLSKSELVQLINMRPSTHVELHAIIEECEDRYSENQVPEHTELHHVRLNVVA